MTNIVLSSEVYVIGIVFMVRKIWTNLPLREAKEAVDITNHVIKDEYSLGESEAIISMTSYMMILTACISLKEYAEVDNVCDMIKHYSADKNLCASFVQLLTLFYQGWPPVKPAITWHNVDIETGETLPEY